MDTSKPIRLIDELREYTEEALRNKQFDLEQKTDSYLMKYPDYPILYKKMKEAAKSGSKYVTYDLSEDMTEEQISDFILNISNFGISSYRLSRTLFSFGWGR